ncbi:nucleotide exchange factor GrpE [Luteimonas sp. RD2P54]|uniref:Protein GrpE n=1 Tax=Luteimonas endophytica TaxID=3042023 RepID=A0ABT6J3P6_9GAMM|nr:nucleotide exchange factor GrpE [Luteimonas endophytica]MDH5821444.1 nucleotide exchange factor GrpE [Luteimonas endophytica]
MSNEGNEHQPGEPPASDQAHSAHSAEQGEDSLHDRIEALEGELEQMRAQSLIERADLDNQRKRLARDLDNARRFANERLLADLLPVLDSLEAGLANASEGEPLRAGVELTLRQLLKVAESNGLVPVAPAPGDAFDPERHQAMSVADSDAVAPGAVAQLFQKGYVLNDRLLRPALVVVARSD